MEPITRTLSHFKRSLEADLPVAVDNHGNWGIESPPQRFYRWLTAGECARFSGIIDAFSKVMDSLEYYNSEDILPYLETAQAICSYASSSPDRWKLDLRIFALKQRLGLGNSLAAPYDHEWLNEAVQWKYRQSYSPNGALNPKQEKAVDDTMKFPEFIKMAQFHKPLMDVFFEWTIRDQNLPELFIHYPGLCIKMMESHFSARVGYDNLVKMEGGSVFLKCEGGKWLDLRAPKAIVELSNKFNVTFEDICSCFSNRKYVFGDVDTNHQGVINWSPRHYGSYDPATGSYKQIDFTAPDWWKGLPEEDILTPQEMQYRYQLKERPDGKLWYFSIVGASESNQEILISGTHGFLLACIPREDGRYSVYSFGKYTYGDFPRTTVDLLRVVLQSVPGRIISPDGTTRESKRDKEYIITAVAQSDGILTMEDIKQDILQGFLMQIPFELFRANCMDWAVEKIRRFLTPLQREACYVRPFEAPVTGVLAVVFKIYHLLPRILTNAVLNLFAWFFGGYNQLMLRARDGSVRLHRFVDTAPWHPGRHRSANPSLLLLKKRNGEVNGM